MKRREPLTLVETLDAIAEAAQPFTDRYRGAMARCVKHLWLVLAVDGLCLLWAALAYYWPFGAAAVFVGACVGVVIATLVSLR